MLNFCKKKVVLTQCYLDVSDNLESNELYIFDHFFYIPTTPPYLVEPGTLKFFANLLKKNGFFGNFISRRFRKFATIWAYLNFWQKICPQGFSPLPHPTPSPLRGANPQNAQPGSWTTCWNEQNEIFSCLKIDDFFFFTSPWWNKSPKDKELLMMKMKIFFGRSNCILARENCSSP